MVSLCSSFPFSFVYSNYNALVPFGYRKLVQTEETPLHNIVRIFKKDKTLIFVFRGTIDQTNSWLENVHFMQIPAQGTIKIEEQAFDYTFSKEQNAAVHSGYVLALTFLNEKLKEYLTPARLEGIEKIILTGHSQGGALAQMFLSHLDLKPEFKSIKLMSYSFGSPRIGNQSFTDDFNQRFGKTNQSFRYVNPSDLVCKLPILNKSFEFNVKGFNTTLDLESINSLVQFGMGFLPEKYKSKIEKGIENTKSVAATIVKTQVGNVQFPEFMPTIFYGETGNLITIEPEPYPQYLENKTEKNDKILSILLNSYNDIQRELTFFQHSIFTYYNALYKQYKPIIFRKIRLQTLPEKML